MSEVVEKGKTRAIIAYFTLIGALIAWSMNSEEKNEFASFHIRQSFGLNILWILFGVLISGFDSWFISLPFYLIFISLWGFGITGAFQGKLSYIPFFGNYFQKWFKKIA